MRRHRLLRPGIQTVALCLAGMSVLPAVPLAAQSHHFVYLSSAEAHTISGFELDPAQGTLTQIAQPPFNQGLNHHALAVHPSGKFLYVINESERSVSGFEIHPITGALTSVPASPFPVMGGAAPKLVVVERSGRFAYVVSSSDLQQSIASSLSIYSVTQTTGTMDRVDTFSLGLFTPVGLVVHPEKNFLYLVGTLNLSVWIYTFQIDPTTGSLSGSGQAGVGEDARSVAMDPRGRFLFVGHGRNVGLVETYTISPDGVLTSAGRFDAGETQAFPHALAVEATGSYLYGAFAGLGLVGFSINPNTGGLTKLADSPFVEPPVPLGTVLVADPHAQFLYYDERAFQIDATGILGLPLIAPGVGIVTGIAAANPLDAVQPILAPVVMLAPPSLSFPDQTVGTSSQPQEIHLSNTGTAPLNIAGISITGTDSGDFGQTHNCLAVLLPSNGCTITITFLPLSAGAREATLTVVDDAIASPHSALLSGFGVGPGAGEPSFTMVELGGSTSNIMAGQTAQYNFQLVPAPGFAGEVLLACTGAPAGAVCQVPPSVPLDGAAPTLFSASVLTTARSALPPLAGRPPEVGNQYFRRILAWGALLALLLGTLPRSRLALAAAVRPQVRSRCAMLLLLVCASLSLVSCAGVVDPGTSSSAGSTTSTGTPAGVYTLTLTAASGGDTQTIPLTLTVR